MAPPELRVTRVHRVQAHLSSIPLTYSTASEDAMRRWTCHHLASQIRQIAAVAVLLMMPFTGPLSAQDVSVDVLGVPGHARLIENLRAAGYSAHLYGPGNRPAAGYEVISIGDQVPPAVAVDIVRRATRLIPSLRYLILTGDRAQPASGPQEIAIGVTNSVLDQFPHARPLAEGDLRRLLNPDLPPEDFHRRIRLTYTRPGLAGDQSVPEAPYIRADGVLVVPNADGTARLYAPNGRRGFLTEEGQEQWLMQDLTPMTPTAETGSVGQAWLDQMNGWLESMAQEMLRDIERMLEDPASMANYKALEDEETSTLYERVTLRREYLSLLISANFNPDATP
jgi:hypothetical protein